MTGLSAGVGVSGVGVPIGTTITAINSVARTITLSANATASGSSVSIGNHTPAGTVIFQYARYLNTNSSSSTYTWSSPNIYSSQSSVRSPAPTRSAIISA